MILLILLITPLVAALALALIGDRRFAPNVNILGSALTLTAGVALAVKVCSTGAIIAGGKFFYVDAFSVYLSVLTS
ncbi:MAG: hydrogenase 4 subunit F, partial [Nitrospirae bacterium]|nr:hydrogenase 4 subunit F [Nitrospirota bacterium]